MPKDSAALTPLELEIMQRLWALGPSGVEAVRETVKDGALAYTTVQTMLNVLHRKGKVTRKLEGRAFVYAPALKKTEAVAGAVRDLIDRMFGGSAENLVMGLIESKQLTPAKLRKLQEKLEKEHGR